VIQAHYEHPHFIVRKTDHMEFEEGMANGFKLMLRWMMNTPKDVKIPERSTKYGKALKHVQFQFAAGKWSRELMENQNKVMESLGGLRVLHGMFRSDMVCAVGMNNSSESGSLA